MNCHGCSSRVPCNGATLVGPEALEGFHYAIVFQCPACRSTRYAVIWESTELDRLLDDSEPTFSAARDSRPDDEKDAA